jgi:hypothetical protein
LIVGGEAMRLKEEHLALSSGIGLAGIAVTNFMEAGRDAMEIFREEIIDCIVKPSRTTAVHYYLAYFQDISKEVELLRDADMGNDYTYLFITKTLSGVGMKAELPEPNFENCSGVDGDSSYHDEKCQCGQQLQVWKNFVDQNAGQIDELIIHSAFQVVYRDRVFLHDFHLELSEFIEDYIEDIKKVHPDCVTEKNRIKRRGFPQWLKNAVFHRDMGTCSNPKCRCDLTKRVRPITNTNFDHIIPLNLFGSNDASNLQLLCESCNTSKGDRSTMTGAVNTPFWNMD